jgi:transposase
MRGTQNQAIGRSRGGLTTKIGALVDALGNLIAFVLVPGQRHDVNLVDKLMHGVACGAFLDDKTFDANKVREFLARNGAVAVIPPRRGTKGADSYDREKYKMAPFDREFVLQDKGVSPHRHPLLKNRHLFRRDDIRRQHPLNPVLIVNTP